MGVLQLAEMVDIRTADAADAEAIYGLAASLFGARQFLYTIYQAPQSVRHIAKMIKAASPANPFVVLKLDGCLLGYYEAVVSDGVCFLNYIGVDTSAAGRGYGRVLLAHFTGLARDCGCSELALDVFESNDRALNWYTRARFERTGKKYFTRVALDLDSSPVREENVVDRDALEMALADEAVHGFSKIPCRLNGHTVVLGFIGGHSCKVLDCGGLEVAEVVERLAPFLANKRQILIVASTAPLQSTLSVVTSETVLRMRKKLN